MKVQLFIKEVCNYFDTTPEILYSFNKCRKREWVTIRQFIYIFLKEYTKMSYAQIGAIFGLDHATSLSGRKTLLGYLETDRVLRNDYKELDCIANRIFKFKPKSVKRRFKIHEVINLIELTLGKESSDKVRDFYNQNPDIDFKMYREQLMYKKIKYIWFYKLIKKLKI